MNEREYAFSDRDFEQLRGLVAQHTGISLSEAKKDLVYGRLSKRLRARSLSSFAAYADLLATDSGDELEQFTNVITTNLTSFFRENHHFEFLRHRAVKEMRARHVSDRRIRIWSAGCSSGEEPYSIAMALRESFPDIDSWDVKILATDLDTSCLARAKAGVYGEDRLEGMSSDRISRWFKKGCAGNEGKVIVDDTLKSLITFKQLNLMGDWPLRGPFDIIFCRNVVIYFDKPTQRVLFERYAKLTAPGGYLVLGHSESLHSLTDKFALLEKTIYRRER